MISTKNVIYQIKNRYSFLKPCHKDEEQLFRINYIMARVTMLIIVFIVDAIFSVVPRGTGDA